MLDTNPGSALGANQHIGTHYKVCATLEPKTRPLYNFWLYLELGGELGGMPRGGLRILNPVFKPEEKWKTIDE